MQLFYPPIITQKTLKPAFLFEMPFAHIDSACLLNSLNFKDRVDFEVSQRPKLRFYRSTIFVC